EHGDGGFLGDDGGGGLRGGGVEIRDDHGPALTGVAAGGGPAEAARGAGSGHDCSALGGQGQIHGSHPIVEGQKRGGGRGGWRSEEGGGQASGAGGRSGPVRVGDVGRLQLEGEVALVAGGGERRDPGGEVDLAVARGEVDVAGPGVADVDVRDLGSVAVDPGQRVIPGGHHVAEVQDG